MGRKGIAQSRARVAAIFHDTELPAYIAMALAFVFVAALTMGLF